MTKIKICGLRRMEDVSYVNDAKPEYIGFVFWDKSKRNVTFSEAKALREALDSTIISVGVFVDRPIEDIIYLTENGIISVVQLHGEETEETINELKDKCPKGTVIIKAFEVKDENDIARAENSIADMVLVDAGKGGGVTFNWGLLKGLKREYFLAGGLSADNVGDAIASLNPYAVDISSKVETDGYKDRDKINEFCRAVRG